MIHLSLDRLINFPWCQSIISITPLVLSKLSFCRYKGQLNNYGCHNIDHKMMKKVIRKKYK